MSAPEISAPGHRPASLKVASGLLGLATMVTRLTTLVIMALLARGAGAEAVGFYGLATLSASFAAAALSVGFPTYLTRNVSAGLVPHPEVARIHTTRLLVMLLAAAICWPVAGFTVPGAVQLGFFLFFLSSLLEQWNETAWVLVRGTRKAWREALANAIASVTLVAACGADALLAGGLSFTRAAVYMALASLLRSVLAFWLSGVWRQLLVPGRVDLVGRSRQAVPYFAADLLGLMYFRGDTLVLALFVAASQVGEYVSATGIVGPAVQVASSMGVGALAYAAPRVLGGGRPDEPVTIFRFFQIAGFGATGVMLAGLPIATLILFGDEGATIMHLAMILALFLALRFANFGLSAVLLAGGKASSRLIVLVVSMLGNVALNLALDGRYGAFGAAWSTVLTELIVASSLLYFLHDRTLLRPVAASTAFVAVVAVVLVTLVELLPLAGASVGTGILFLAGAAAVVVVRRRFARPAQTANTGA
ncbi:lipopolysaccharide biosynthesis protein [Actinoplanes sp. NPDC051851]|uniref:lipopolysaccharide biosynthesis protein n=1 Tax=Actinoplanes sp. NPDC051851 TaxID=3154753 RepID=UPI00343EE330